MPFHAMATLFLEFEFELIGLAFFHILNVCSSSSFLCTFSDCELFNIKSVVAYIYTRKYNNFLCFRFFIIRRVRRFYFPDGRFLIKI